ncbi:MAG TPA: YbaY family lipoprotein [Opitutus sp.]|nr:YbaY family lipoprotein [Opitutus sp.]
MKTSLLVPLAFAAALFLSGCGHLDTTVTNGEDRVLNGVISAVDAGAGTALPAETEVLVRVLDLGRGFGRGEELGEQTIKGPVEFPVPFRIEYRADDATLRGSVEVEARISVGGQLRYVTITGHPITLGNVNQSHVVMVERARNP